MEEKLKRLEGENRTLRMTVSENKRASYRME